MKRRTLMGVVFYPGEERRLGTLVELDRKNAAGGRDVIQVHELVAANATWIDKKGALQESLQWHTKCVECGEGMDYRASIWCKNLKRRCADCNHANPYDPKGWNKRPRNRFVRVDPHLEDDWTTARYMSERGAPDDEIDPASLF